MNSLSERREDSWLMWKRLWGWFWNRKIRIEIFRWVVKGLRCLVYAGLAWNFTDDRSWLWLCACVDHSKQISIYDSGPKLLSVGTASSNAYKSFDIRVSSVFLLIDFITSLMGKHLFTSSYTICTPGKLHDLQSSLRTRPRSWSRS